MSPRHSCLRILLIASLWTVWATLAAADSLFRPGVVELALSTTSVSAIPIDYEAMALQGCTGEEPQVIAKCLILSTVRGDMGMSTGDKGAFATATQFLTTDVVVTPCGTWDVTLALDPDFSQPDSPMTFEQAPEDPGHGVFSGVLKMNTALHLANRDTGQTEDFAIPIAFDLAGPWAVDSTDESSDTSDLVLFADRIDGDIVPIDTRVSVHFWKHFNHTHCDSYMRGVTSTGSPR
jgi:hypothetical protein